MPKTEDEIQEMPAPLEGARFLGHTARAVLLPRFQLTELTEATEPAAVPVHLPEETYYVRPKLVPDEGKRRDGRPNWVRHEFNLYPLVLDSAGAPWAEANVYLLSRIEDAFRPEMPTYGSIAADLAAYRGFLDEHEVDWTNFPVQKLARPTYRFNGHLKYEVLNGVMSPSVAQRRMSSVVGFYRWLSYEQVFVPLHPAWKESDRYVHIPDARGIRQRKMVKTTDLAIRVPVQADPYAGLIEDGGKLRPMVAQEQEWLIEALVSLRNTEMTLIHFCGLFTGARIQTVLTMRVKHALMLQGTPPGREARLPVGHSTGVDTKFSKRMVLHVPAWLCEALAAYAISDRARGRRERAPGGDHIDQYLFLSQRSAPLYEAKEHLHTFNAAQELHHRKVGQGVRQFIRERVIPLIREKHSVTSFSYQYHDTRATAGMNWTDRQLLLVAQGKSTLHEAREFVRVRMGHERAEVTDRYLKYRQNQNQVRWVVQEHERHLERLAAGAIEGLW